MEYNDIFIPTKFEIGLLFIRFLKENDLYFMALESMKKRWTEVYCNKMLNDMKVDEPFIIIYMTLRENKLAHMIHYMSWKWIDFAEKANIKIPFIIMHIKEDEIEPNKFYFRLKDCPPIIFIQDMNNSSHKTMGRIYLTEENFSNHEAILKIYYPFEYLDNLFMSSYLGEEWFDAITEMKLFNFNRIRDGAIAFMNNLKKLEFYNVQILGFNSINHCRNLKSIKIYNRNDFTRTFSPFRNLPFLSNLEINVLNDNKQIFHYFAGDCDIIHYTRNTPSLKYIKINNKKHEVNYYNWKKKLSYHFYKFLYDSKLMHEMNYMNLIFI